MVQKYTEILRIRITKEMSDELKIKRIKDKLDISKIVRKCLEDCLKGGGQDESVQNDST